MAERVDTHEEPTVELRYHVPRSQVWEGSRGGQRGKVHIHIIGSARLLTADASGEGRYSTITRGDGMALCRRAGWYERPGESGEELCPRCADLAERYRVPIPPLASDHPAQVTAADTPDQGAE